jgi:NAD(P)H-dependent FMN reductase
MRTALFALTFIAICAPAFAQKQSAISAPTEQQPAPTGAPAPAASQPAPDSSQQAAPSTPAPSTSADVVTGFVETFLFDSGLFDAFMQHEQPRLRASIINSPVYVHATPAHQAALQSFADTVPDILRHEVHSEVPAIAASSGDRIMALISADDLRSLADFLKSDEGRPVIQMLTQQYVANPTARAPDLSPLTNEQLGAITRFSQTPAGHAFTAHGDAVFTILGAEFQAASARATPRVTQRMAAGMCEALADQCPSALRRAANQI